MWTLSSRYTVRPGILAGRDENVKKELCTRSNVVTFKPKTIGCVRSCCRSQSSAVLLLHLGRAFSKNHPCLKGSLLSRIFGVLDPYFIVAKHATWVKT